MPVDRRPTDRFHSDRDQARASLIAQVNFIVDNRELLRRRRRGQEHVTAIFDFWRILVKQKEDLTPAQASYVESMYEMVMEELGMPSVKKKRDHNVRRLRYPK